VTARAVVLGALLMLGCAVGNQLIAPHDQYRLYRATRVAPTLEERLSAGNRYLHLAPAGAYADEVHAWFRDAERSYLARAHDQLPMLYAYLRELPDGPSVAQVKDRIEELESAARFAEGRRNARNQRVESLEMGLERAATQRKAFLADLGGWLTALALVRSYGQPVSALPPDLLARFQLTDPAQGCPLDVCEKAVTPRFAIPHVATQLVPREAPYAAELTTSAGILTGSRLHGRELFSRIAEALDLRPVSFADPQSRAEAIGSALSLVTNALGNDLAADSCVRPAVSPVVLERACAGVHVVVTAAVDEGSDDSIAFGPETPPAPAAPPVAPARRPKR
jgi:hypothetical protein